MTRGVAGSSTGAPLGCGGRSAVAAVPSPSGVALSATGEMLYVSSYTEGAVYALDLAQVVGSR